MLCGGRRRRHGCWKPTGLWTSMASKQTPGCSSHRSTSYCASNCPTWSTWRSRSTSQIVSLRLCLTSAKLSVSGTITWRTGKSLSMWKKVKIWKDVWLIGWVLAKWAHNPISNIFDSSPVYSLLIHTWIKPCKYSFLAIVCTNLLSCILLESCPWTQTPSVSHCFVNWDYHTISCL